MSLPVFLGPVTGVAAGATVVVEGDEARHAVVVRRTRVGEQVVLVDGRAPSATGTVTATSKSALTVDGLVGRASRRPEPVGDRRPGDPEGRPGELAVEVLTEIGVDRIVPWAASRSVGVWRGERADEVAGEVAGDRARGRQAVAPRVAARGDRAGHDRGGRRAGRAADLAVVLHEAATASARPVSLDGVASIVVVVGPEGGITDEELAAFGAGARRTDGGAGAAYVDRRCRGRRGPAVTHLALG